jgi:hypothetical protein
VEGGGAIGAACKGVDECDGGPCSLGFLRLGSSGSVSFSNDIKFDLRGSAAGFDIVGGGVFCIDGGPR